MGYEVPAATDVFTDPRTGLIFINQDVAERLGYNKPIEYNMNPASPSYGEVSNSQRGFQYWMDADYTAPQPTMSEKLDYSTVDNYEAYKDRVIQDIIAARSTGILGSGGGITVQKTPAKQSTQTTSPANSPGSTNEPAYVQNDTNQTETGSSAGTGSGGLSGLSQYAIYLAAGIALLFIVLIAGSLKGSGRSVTA